MTRNTTVITRPATTLTCNAKGCTACTSAALAPELGWVSYVAPERGTAPDGTPRLAWLCPEHAKWGVQSEEVTGAVTTGIVWQYRIMTRACTPDGHGALTANGWAWEHVPGQVGVACAVSERRPNAKDRSAGFHDLEDRRQARKLQLRGKGLGVTATLESRLTPEEWDDLELWAPYITAEMRYALAALPEVSERILGGEELSLTVKDGVATLRCPWVDDHQVEEACRMAETLLHAWHTWGDRKGWVKVASIMTGKLEGKGFPESTPRWKD